MTVLEFFVNLVVDLEAPARFRLNPYKAMAEAGISDADQQVIIKGDVSSLFAPGAPPQKVAMGLVPPDETVIEAIGNPLDKKGLTIVGLGIRALQATPEARVCIEQASKVLYLVADPVSEGFVRTLNPTAETLANFYQTHKTRNQIYNEMVDKILSCLEESGDVCVVFYGHPAVLCYPTREALRRARQMEFSARVLPGVSALDNLIADLGIDLAALQSFEATAFLIYRYPFATTAGLVLWQVDVLGELQWEPDYKAVPARLKVLADYMAGFYGPDHEVFLYRAASLPSDRPQIEHTTVGELPGAKHMEGATLYVPPKERPKLDSDMVEKLHMQSETRS